jgi:hypothetical protein
MLKIKLWLLWEYIKHFISNKCDECCGTGIYTEPDEVTKYKCVKCNGSGKFQCSIT